MKIALIVGQENPEMIWNAFRLANMMLESKDEVSIFSNGPSVRYERWDSEQFPQILIQGLKEWVLPLLWPLLARKRSFGPMSGTVGFI